MHVTLDWTSEGDQYLLVVSLVVSRRVEPIFWRAYRASLLKGRYETAVVKRAFKLLFDFITPLRALRVEPRGRHAEPTQAATKPAHVLVAVEETRLGGYVIKCVLTLALDSVLGYRIYHLFVR